MTDATPVVMRCTSCGRPFECRVGHTEAHRCNECDLLNPERIPARAHTVRIHETPHPVGLPGNLVAECSCGWTSTALFSDSLQRAIVAHEKGGSR